MVEDEKKPDRRVAKTKKAIKTAFAKLLSEKDINSITVKDVADCADINRKTFYNYYAGIYQVIDEIENDIIDEFDKTIHEIDFDNEIQNPYTIFDKLTAVIGRDIDFYGYLMKMDNNVSLISKISGLLKDRLKAAFYERVIIDAGRLDMIVEFAISGMTAVYQSWFNSDRSISFEVLSKDMGVMTIMGVSGFLNTDGKKHHV
jgi:AcrR family transcriptional regulator